MAIMVMQGLQLGIAECVAITIIIGFSIDYVVHMAVHYVHCTALSRFDKSTDSVSAMGVSIFSGAVAKISVGVFVIVFFYSSTITIIVFKKFAIIITTTVIFSISYALVYFLALMHTIGPQQK